MNLEIITINDESLKLFYQGIYKHKEELNTIIWYFDSDKDYQEFFEKNQAYVISFLGIPLEKLLVECLKQNNLHISFAESCTGGMLVSTLVNASGASNVLNESYVTYSIDAKTRVLGVKKETIDKYTVYSPQTAKEMVEGLYEKTKAEVCVSVTGRAGGGASDPLDGLFDYAILTNIGGKNHLHIDRQEFKGTRNDVRKMQTTYILWQVLRIINMPN